MQIDPAERHANMISTMWDLKQTNKKNQPNKTETDSQIQENKLVLVRVKVAEKNG